MACFHPLPAIANPKGGRYRVGKEHEHFIPYIDFKTGELVEEINIPCGQCIGCRLDKSRRWADRCTLEAVTAPKDTSWFVTLTYAPEHESVLKNSLDALTLRKDHLAEFNKKLLRYWSYHYNHEGIRFYGCGEYGDTNFRPHMHVLYFNLPLKDLQYHFTQDGNAYYQSEELAHIWGFSDFVIVTPFSWQNAAYTARYVMKKVTGKNAKAYYEALDLQPEFTQMSRMPGIGREYYEKHKESIYRKIALPDKTLYQTSFVLPNGMERTKNNYFDYLMKKEDPEFVIFLGEGRKHIAELRNIDIMQHTDLSEADYRVLQESIKKNSIKQLTRCL